MKEKLGLSDMAKDANKLSFGMVCRLLACWRSLFLGVADVRFLATVTAACANRTGATASVERRRREPARAMSLE